MKLHYYPETDSLYIELKSDPGVETREIAAGLVADLDAQGVVVGLDIDGASTRLDLTTLETIALPVKTTRRLALDELRQGRTPGGAASPALPSPRKARHRLLDDHRPRFPDEMAGVGEFRADAGGCGWFCAAPHRRSCMRSP